jgi:2Fe-2S ferredoxin
MGMVKVTDRDGARHEVEATQGDSLMEILRDAGLPVDGTCGGQCICSTCHVYVEPFWFAKLEPRAEEEQVMVEDTGHFQDNSRLACQLDFSAALDGIEVTLAPEY